MQFRGASNKMDNVMDDVSSDFLPDLNKKKKHQNSFYLILKFIMQMNNSLELELIL